MIKIEKITIVFGILQGLLAFATYAYTDFRSFTALIPVVPGGILVVLGLIAQRERWRSLAAHVAVSIGFITALFFFVGLNRLRPLLRGEELGRPVAVVEMMLMGLISLVYVGFCVKYFLEQRKERKK